MGALGIIAAAPAPVSEDTLVVVCQFLVDRLCVWRPNRRVRADRPPGPAGRIASPLDKTPQGADWFRHSTRWPRFTAVIPRSAFARGVWKVAD